MVISDSCLSVFLQYYSIVNKGEIQNNHRSYDIVNLLKNVWIGENAVILAGSKIGDGCVIGANTVVSKEIPPNSIVVGHNEVIRQY